MKEKSTLRSGWFGRLLQSHFREEHLLLSLIAFMLMMSVMLFYGDLFTNQVATHGILSLQWCMDSPRGHEILQSWQHPVDPLKAVWGTTWNQLSYARVQTGLDYLFITVYVLFGIVLVNVITGYLSPLLQTAVTEGRMTQEKAGRYLQQLYRWQTMATAGMLLAGVCDMVEDAFMLAALWKPAYYVAAGVYVPAMIKFLILFLVALSATAYSVRWILNHVGGLVAILVRFRIVTAGLLLMFAVLFVLDQGQDLLLSINAHWEGPMITMVVMSILAAANWYLPKYYDEEDDTKITFHAFFFGSWEYKEPAVQEADIPETRKQKRFVARLMGAGTLLLVGVGILHALHVFRMTYVGNFFSPSAIFFSLMIFYYLLAHKGWLCNGKTAAAIITVIILFILLITAFINTTAPMSLAWLALDFILLSFAFMVYTNVRRQAQDDFLAGLPVYKWSLTPVVIFPVLLVSSLFLLANVFPEAFIFGQKWKLLCLPIIFCGIICYELFFTLLLMWGRKHKVHGITILFLVLVFLGVISRDDFHKLRRVAKTDVHVLSLDDYAKAWLMARQAEIHMYDADTAHHSAYPVFIISTYGGGIRAAAWTSKVVDVINTRLDGNQDFQRNVFAYSGASGGTIGAAVQCARRYTELTAGGTHEERPDFYKRDFLTPVLVGMLGRDVWLFTFGDGVADRGALQEEAWEVQAKREGFHLDYPFAAYWDIHGPNRTLDIPLLFSNTYDINDGVKGITAPVTLKQDDFPAVLLTQDKLDKDSITPNRTMLLSTAAFTSARFPFVSPTGKLDDFHHFTDGGTLENSGGETAWSVKSILERNLQDLNARTPTIDSISFVIVSIDNTEVNADSILKPKPFFELGAPLVGVINLGVGNTYKADYSNWLRAGRQGFEYVKIRPAYIKDSVGFLPVQPLGWQISDSALARMDRSARKDTNIAHIVARLRTGTRIPLNPVFQR